MTTSSSDGQPWIVTEKLGRAPCDHCGVMLNVAEFYVFELIECPECGEATRVPGKLGNFFLLKELGRGGMGSVFLAKDAELQRKVALKVLNAKYGEDPKFVDALQQEAQAAAGLNHRNIVHMYSFGQVSGQPYIVMELVDGIRLDECIDADTEQEEAGWLGIMEQVAEGLAVAEMSHLVHGDIKPANILLNEHGVAKLSDFGIARYEGAKDERILGTPLYIAPEKAKGESVDSRSDQFSLGASFWHIFTGVPPYPGKNAQEVVARRFEHPQPDIRLHAPHLSHLTANLLRKMMATEPEDRFASFRELIREIRRIPEQMQEQKEKELAKRRALEERAALLQQQKAQRRNTMIGIMICMVLISLILFFIFK